MLHFENDLRSATCTWCPISETFERVLSLNDQLAKVKHAQIHVDIKQNLFVKGIPAYIDSICYNLVSNALKYGVTETQKDIYITARKIKHRVVIEVKDQGLGIDLERYKDKIFKIGSRFHTNEQGQGMGLLMTKLQIEAMGGTIQL